MIQESAGGLFPRMIEALVWRPTTKSARYVLALAPFCIALAFWWAHPALVIDADSPRYLTNSPLRTATYPLFLDVAYGPALLPIQLSLFASALSWLSVYSSKFLPWSVCAAMSLLVGANPYVWVLQASVMSEALTIPLLTLIVGCAVGFFANQDRRLLIAMSVLAGIACSARPPLLPLILVPLCATWMANSAGRLALSIAIFGAWAAPIAAERIYSHAVHGPELTSPLGRTLFMKAAVISGPPTRISSRDIIDRQLVMILNRDFEPARQTIRAAPDRDIRYILLTNYEACAWLACIKRTMQDPQISEAELHRHMLRVAIRRIYANPSGYLELVATEYHRMWLLHPRKIPNLASKYNAFLERTGPIPLQSLLGVEGQPTPSTAQQPLLRLNRIAFAAIGILAAGMTIGFTFWRRSACSKLALVLLVGTQGVLVLSALTGVGLPRYAMGMWPMIISGEVFGLVAVLRWGDPRFDMKTPFSAKYPNVPRV